MWRCFHSFRAYLRPIIALNTGRVLLTSVICDDTLHDVSKIRQGKVHLWGERSALPCGGSHQLFDDARRWNCITFGPNFGAAVDNSGDVYLWGQTKEGNYVEPFAIGVTEIVECCCSATDVYMLSRKGKVHVIRNVIESLTYDGNSSNDISLPSPEDAGVTTACLTNKENRADDNSEPHRERIPRIEHMNGLHDKRIVKMSVGNAHAAFIDTEGKLYTTGDNTFGQCGRKPTNVQSATTFLVFPVRSTETPDIVELQKVEFKDPDTEIVDVICGGRHTCCLDSNGTVYTFGDDSAVQLFLGDTRGRTILELDQYRVFSRRKDHKATSYTKYTHKDKHLQFNPIPVSHIGKLSEVKHVLDKGHIGLAAGDDFTIVSSTSKEKENRTTQLIASGENRYGQCATSDFRMQHLKTVNLPGRIKPNGLSCGRGHCLAALESGTLLCWGSNQHQQLGSDRRGNIMAPTALRLPSVKHAKQEGGQEKEIAFARCSFNNTAVIIK